MASTPLCTISYCPAKNDPFWHRCFVCEATAIDHHHVENRGSGGSKRDIPVVALCRGCHEKVTLNVWGNSVQNGEYRVFDLHNNTIVRKQLEGADRGDSEAGATLSDITRRASPAPLPVPSELTRGECICKLGADGFRYDIVCPQHDGGATLELTRGECIARARALREERERNPWNMGDLLNNAEALGDVAGESWDPVTGEDLVHIMGLQPETSRQYQNLADQFPPPRLASMGHAQACYKQPDFEQWMKLSFESNWSVSRLRQEIRGGEPEPKAKVRRWTMEQLCEAWEWWERNPTTEEATTDDWLDWLEGTDA